MIAPFVTMLVALALQASQAAPSPPPLDPHFRNPDHRIVHISYACSNGTRSITMGYEQVPKGTIIALTWNGKPAPGLRVENLNELLARFSLVSTLYPQCGGEQDTIFVSGMIDRKYKTIWIVWSPHHVELVAEDVR